MQKKVIFKVEEGEEGQRLDLFAAIKLVDMSRRDVKRLIDEGKVMINSKIEYRPHHKMNAEEEIEVQIEENKGKKISIIPENIKLDIVFEDEDLLAINKPYGMVVHPAETVTRGTLMNGVIYHFKEIAQVGNNIRSGLIHRLDKDTSGIILIGKTTKGLWFYSKQFAERKVQKIYLAIVAGNIYDRIHNESYLIQDFLGRNPLNRQKMSSSSTNGRLSKTMINFIKNINIEGKECSLVVARPMTGRTHQIRVHLSELGFPILGDDKYGKKNRYHRLLLHAWKIKIEHLNLGIKEFEAKIPLEFMVNKDEERNIEHIIENKKIQE
jgi:23S rRNA pseudouridine1911/1915/1917 synthase